tara:strand:+ start:3971 stop:4840 length:870 start_codon:yes stop_codon:yes gene_type:complete
MTNPTSNFGWQMPTSTDLVTDLPADFAVFGQAVDTSMADLLGGTTGQVLKKNSNTNMDFVWSVDSAGMTNPMTTTGDTIYSSSGSTPARLGIGTSGQVLAVSGGVPAWTTLASSTPTMYEVRFTASTTWTVPTGVTKVWVTMIGGGGGGANYGTYLGEAGKHGAVTNEMLSVTPAASITVTIGAGGAGGTGGSGENGTAGNQSAFGSLTAAGGYFGAASMWAASGLGRGKQAEATPINGGVTNSISNDAVGIAGTANTGGGGGSSRTNTGGSPNGGAGGSGFIFIRYVI